MVGENPDHACWDPTSQQFSFMFKTIEKDMFLFVLTYQNISFWMVLIIKEIAVKVGVGGLLEVIEWCPIIGAKILT